MLCPFAGRYYNKRRHFFSYDFKDYSFKVDLEFGELYFTRKLMSFSGKHLPLNLSLKYVQSHINGSDCLCSLTGFPQGFKTNFHVFLEFDSDSNKYKYEDADGFVHEFTLAYNSSTLYYDNQGSGLMLITQNNGYKVFDDDGNYQLFDQYGRLTLIYKKVTSTEYYYIDGQLLKENTGNKTITYIYSHQGIIGFSLSGYSAISNLNGTYLFEKNVQQDVIAIRNSSNQIVARYIYDAWGNHKVLNPNNTPNTSDSFIGNINPTRYRSYYYDTDLKMYWLTTRYYDPEIGRFISSDHYSYLDCKKLHGINLYAYSKNNPVMYYDPSGHSILKIIFAVAKIWEGIGSLVNFLTEDKDKDRKKEKEEIAKGNSDAIIKDHTLSTGRTVYFDKNIDWTDEKANLRVYDSWQLTKAEIIEFLEWLKHNDDYKNNVINVNRMLNEWIWHNKAFNFGFGKDSSRSVDVCLNADDTDRWYSFILNWRLWA